ncbi:NmrA family NAD(P)-binding protein [Silvibacterium acidisoli]|uniref:NmrA family NAD(P)-binding protein n=1 Tax=Acidobacteriaceae bacterium ZG23-2 TaxID=2883246 RepID=UPI00406D1C70
MKPRILIAGAAGSTGRVATRLLVEQGFPVRALVHKEDDRSSKLVDLGAEVAVGDLLDVRALRRAFQGVQRAYFVYPIRPGLVEAAVYFAEAALEAKTEFLVSMSQRTAREDALSNAALAHWIAERVFDWAGTPVAHLRPTIFHNWLLYMRKGIKAGKYHVPFGTAGRFAPIAAEDLGHVIAAMLAHPDSHVGKVYELFGPAELTAPQVAEEVSIALGRQVNYQQVPPEEWISDIYEGKQVIPYLAQHLAGITYDQDHNMMAGTNDVVEMITGRKPQNLADFVKQNRAAFE